MLCRRVIFKKPKEVAIEEVEIPAPSSEQILIKTSVTLISTGTELTMLSGEFPQGSVWDQITKYPVAPGYSNCGVVVEIGREVKNVKVGNKVVSYAPHSEYAVIGEDAAVKVPEGVSDEEAIFSSLAATVMNGVRLADISLGECVVVVGVGILGQLACQFSRLFGGFPVVAVDLSQKRLEMARKLGVNVALRSGKDDVAGGVQSLTSGRGADVVFEVTGNPEAIPGELSLVKQQGRLVLLSSPRGPSTLDFHDHVNRLSKVIIGTHVSSHPAFETPYNPWTRRRNTELFFDLLLAGLVNVKDLITHRYPWTRAAEAYEELLDPLGQRLQAMGVLLDFR